MRRLLCLFGFHVEELKADWIVGCSYCDWLSPGIVGLSRSRTALPHSDGVNRAASHGR